jgi:TrmH family RNA methyltransferase
MITNNEIKLINSLSRKKERMAHGLFIVEGNKSVAEVLQSDFVVKQIYGVDDEFAHHELYKGVSPKQLERISQYKTATEALALVELPKTQKADVSAPSILL